MGTEMMVPGRTFAAAALLLHAATAQDVPITVSCDSEGELLANLLWVRDACSQAGEPSFERAEVDALVPSAVTTHGCAGAVRRVAGVCEGLLARSPLWFASRRRERMERPTSQVPQYHLDLRKSGRYVASSW